MTYVKFGIEKLNEGGFIVIGIPLSEHSSEKALFATQSINDALEFIKTRLSDQIQDPSGT